MFDWFGYVLKSYSFVEYAPEMRVLDVGCGTGAELQELRRRGCLGFGIDPQWEAVVNCRRQGLRVLQACAEQMPFKNASLDGLICKGVIPFTEEPLALREIGRVLKAGAVSRLMYVCAGYYLRFLLFGPTWQFRFYGLRTLLNTWLYAVTGRRLPAFLGDTIYQSRPRVAPYYHKNKLRLWRESLSRTFLGFPVFIYHDIQKVTD